MTDLSGRVPSAASSYLRRWLFALSGLAALSIASQADAEVREFNLTIDEMTIQVAPDLKFQVFAFDGQVPGPLIHVKQGDNVVVHVTNNTTLPHTIHWHGQYQHNNWQMDGVPGVTQKAIEPGDTFTYKFKAEKTGSTWYHCHVNVSEHVGMRGMWGPLIVDPAKPTAPEKKVTKDVIVMLSSWDSQYAEKLGSGGSPLDRPNYFSINGKAFPLTQPINVKKGDVVRLRLFARGETSMQIKHFAAVVAATAMMFGAGASWAKTVKVTMHAKETSVAIDNKGTQYAAWTFDGTIPGPVVRVTEGDTVEFTLINDKENKNSHAMDFHAAVVDVLNEFAPVKPGETKKFNFVAKYPGVFMYHCGAMPMQQHIARGMYGIIIVDPKRGYTKDYPKPDREYVLVQGQFFPDADNDKAMLVNEGWSNSLINGKIFHYDPVHDPNASLALVSKPVSACVSSS